MSFIYNLVTVQTLNENWGYKGIMILGSCVVGIKSDFSIKQADSVVFYELTNNG